jgi:hypothetical protein
VDNLYFAPFSPENIRDFQFTLRVDNSSFSCGVKCGRIVDLWKQRKKLEITKCIKMQNI